MFAVRRNIRRGLIGRADAARDLKQYSAAAALYSEALRLQPADAPIHVQCGHMFKESGDFESAEQHYLAAHKMMPDDPDLALQLGHFYKTAGRLDEAANAYRDALRLSPNWAEPAKELENLHRYVSDVEAVAEKLGLVADIDDLAPELIPREPKQLLHSHRETIDIRRLGRRENSRWGMPATLRGVEAIRGFCVSTTPVSEVQIRLDGELIHSGAPKGGYILTYEIDKEKYKKYVFNVWHDFSDIPRGAHQLEFRVLSPGRRPRTHRELVVVRDPIPEWEYPGCDGLLGAAPGDARTLDEQINARPSMVRPAQRAFLADPPRSILVLRTDQLGDLICSIPALRRLRAAFPAAHIVGLFSAGNIDLARTLGLFDELLVVDFPDIWWERRRVMPLPEQKKLKDRLQPYEFDLAIDLAESGVSRPLLRLSGAKFLFGFRDQEFRFLTAGYQGDVRDPFNGMEAAPHSTKVLAAINRLTDLAETHGDVLRRADLDRTSLEVYGIGPDDEYVILHRGARITYSRWSGYDDLSSLLLEKTTYKVIMMTDDQAVRATLPEHLLQSSRFQLIDSLLPFDHFDALLSFCLGFVGNDSGPKHLASLRGANVVSIHMARNNWAEWGQEHSGYIMSRKVPCAGCGIYYDPEECGRDFVCINGIKPQEVFDALLDLISGRRTLGTRNPSFMGPTRSELRSFSSMIESA